MISQNPLILMVKTILEMMLANKEEFKENQNDLIEENQENSLETNDDSIDGFDQDDDEDESIEEENNTQS